MTNVESKMIKAQFRVNAWLNMVRALIMCTQTDNDTGNSNRLSEWSCLFEFWENKITRDMTAALFFDVFTISHNLWFPSLLVPLIAGRANISLNSWDKCAESSHFENITTN